MNIANIRKASVLDQAREEVNKELNDKAKEKMKALLRQRAAAESVLKGIDLQIQDLEQQIIDGTL